MLTVGIIVALCTIAFSLLRAWAAKRGLETASDFIGYVDGDLCMATSDRLNNADYAIGAHNRQVEAYNQRLAKWPERLIARRYNWQPLAPFKVA